MDYKKSAFMLILTLFVLFTIAGAYAGDVNEATMAITDTDNLGISEDAQLTEPANGFADVNDAINVSSSLNEIQEDDSGAAETYESKSADKEILSAGEGNVQGSKVITVKGSSFEDIEDAIKSASDGDIIKLSNITYSWSGDEITISKQITIDGNDAVLYAKEKGRIFYVTGKNVVFNNVGFYGGSRLEGGAICFSDSSSNCIVSNCGFTQNHATYGSAIYDEGRNNCVLNCSIYENLGEYGAIRSKGFNMTISGCDFFENEGTTGAGAVFLAGSHETIVNCVFYQNFAKKYGGAVMLNYNSVNCSVINSTFVSNYVKYAEAGAISNTGNGNIIYNCNFQSNYAEEGGSVGAAIELGGNNLQISYCNFTYHNADYGAAIYLNDKAYNCTVSNSIFSNNAVIYDGAAIYDNGSNNKILSSEFYRHDAVSGSVYLSGSNATIDGCVFSENIGQYGGAVYLNDKAYNCTVSNSSFSNNGATKGGAAIYDKGSDNKILTSEFSENQAASGSVYLSGINVKLDDCVFSENTCLYGAAIMLNESSSASLISNSKFYNNTANLGAIYNEGQSRITDSIFDNNSADFGGAVYNYDELEIVNCDFSSNWANRGVENGTTVVGINASSNCGGAILNYGYLKLSRSTFKDNHALILGGSICNLATLDLENSIFEKNHAIYAGAILNLFNMTVTGCNFTENTAIKTGAIINQGFGMIVKSIFKANSAMADGGAVSNYENSTLTVIDSTLENNHAQTYGGAISNHGVFDVKNTGFKNNYVNVGGAIINYATSNIEKCTFENNNATDNGGAIFSNEGTLTVTDSNFTANGAKIGGAINTQNCTFVISNSRLTNNRAESVGGAIVCFAGADGHKASANIVNVTVDNNSAATYGGGIYSANCDLTISDSRLSNNRVSEMGGAIYSNCKLVLKNSILESNSAKYASAVYLLKGNESSFTNSVIAKNTATDGGTVVTLESSLKIMNSTFSENTAVTASAILTDNGDSLNIASHTIFIDNTDNMNSVRAQKGSVNTSNCEFLYTISFEIAHIDDVVAKSPITIGVVAKMINGHKFNGYVTVNIGSESYKVQIVNGSGKLKVTPNLACGKYKAKINFNSSDFVPTSAQSNEFEILKRPANIKISKIADFVKGGSLTINVSADSYFSGNLTVSIGGADYVVNVVKGSGSQKISPALAVGTYSAEIKFAGDNVFTAQNLISNKFKVTKIPTTISASAVTSVYSDGKNLVATLMDGSKKAIKGVKVTVKLSNGKSYNRTTDKNGQVKLSVSSLVPKTYYATISFAGNSDYAASSKKVKVTVKKLSTKIVPSKITFKKKETKKVSMVLKDKNNKVLKGKTVSFVFQKKTYKVKTNSKGVATYTFAKINSGTYALTFKFAGDSYYNAVSKSVKVVVKK